MSDQYLIDWKKIVRGSQYYDVQFPKWIGSGEVTFEAGLTASRVALLTGPYGVLAAVAAEATDSNVESGAFFTIDYDIETSEVSLLGVGTYNKESFFGASNTSRVNFLTGETSAQLKIPVYSAAIGSFGYNGEEISTFDVGLQYEYGKSKGSFYYLGNHEWRLDIEQDLGLGAVRVKSYKMTIPQEVIDFEQFDPTLGTRQSVVYSGENERTATVTYVKAFGSGNGVEKTTTIVYAIDENDQSQGSPVSLTVMSEHKANGETVHTVINEQHFNVDLEVIGASTQSFTPGSEDLYISVTRDEINGIYTETFLILQTKDGVYTSERIVRSFDPDTNEVQYFSEEPDGTQHEVTEESFLERLGERQKHIQVYCFAPGTPVDMADGSQKPIEQVKVGDFVLAYDPEQQNGLGDLAPRRVMRTYATADKLVLDFHGVLVTPGHVFLCGDGPHEGKHRMLIDILRDDGAVVAADGRALRAATNAPLGSPEDAFLQVRYLSAGAKSVHREGRLRAGTLLLTEAGETVSVLQLLEAEGYAVTRDGLIARDDEAPHPLHWYGPLPRPEDYVLQVSNLTDADLSGDPDYLPEVASEGGPILGAGWSPRQDDAVPSLFVAGCGAPQHGGETLH